jgi:hypothetical protein
MFTFFALIMLSVAQADAIPIEAPFPETGILVKYTWGESNPYQITPKRGRVCAIVENRVYTFRVTGDYMVWTEGSDNPSAYHLDPAVQTQDVGVSEVVVSSEYHPDQEFRVTYTVTRRTCKLN